MSLRLKSFALVWLVLLAFVVAGCSRSALDLPAGERQANYDRAAGGSCAWACLVTLLRIDGQTDEAAYVRQHCVGPSVEIWLAGAQTFKRCDIVEYLDGRCVSNDYTLSGSPAWLASACEGGGCIVPTDRYGDGRGGFVACNPGDHAVLLAALDNKTATIIDPNQPQYIERMPAKAFIASWRRSGGWSVRLKRDWEL